jgi:hypothetical protein
MEQTIKIGDRTLAIRPTRETYRKLLGKVGSLQRVLAHGCRTPEDASDMLDVVFLSLNRDDQIVGREWLGENLSRLKMNEALEAIGFAYHAAASSWLRQAVA